MWRSALHPRGKRHATVHPNVSLLKCGDLLRCLNTRLRRASDGSLHVRGTTSSNRAIKAVRINGHPARPLASDLSEWEVMLSGDIVGAKLAAAAESETGVNEATPHELSIADGTARRGDVPRD